MWWRPRRKTPPCVCGRGRPRQKGRQGSLVATSAASLRLARRVLHCITTTWYVLLVVLLVILALVVLVVLVELVVLVVLVELVVLVVQVQGLGGRGVAGIGRVESTSTSLPTLLVLLVVEWMKDIPLLLGHVPLRPQRLFRTSFRSSSEVGIRVENREKSSREGRSRGCPAPGSWLVVRLA